MSSEEAEKEGIKFKKTRAEHDQYSSWPFIKILNSNAEPQSPSNRSSNVNKQAASFTSKCGFNADKWTL